MRLSKLLKVGILSLILSVVVYLLSSLSFIDRFPLLPAIYLKWLSIILYSVSFLILFYILLNGHKKSFLRVYKGLINETKYEQIVFTFLLNSKKCIMYTNKYNLIKNGDDVVISGREGNGSINVYYLFNLKTEKIIKTSLFVYLVIALLIWVTIFYLLIYDINIEQLNRLLKPFLLFTLPFLGIYYVLLLVDKINGRKIFMEVIKRK